MNNRPTTLHLPGHLPYPIIVSSLLVKPESPIKKHDGLLVYKFFVDESEEQDDQEVKPVKKEMVEQFDSPWEGILTEWLVKEGTVVQSSK
jgi:RNA polymerase II subunit A C-terminal domain phosphatase